MFVVMPERQLAQADVGPAPSGMRLSPVPPWLAAGARDLLATANLATGG